MAAALKALARITALLMLMAVAVGSTRGAAVDQADLEAPATAALGDGSCGFEDDHDEIVVCGRELLGGLIEASWLVMPEGQCNEMLARLFDAQRCSLDDADCQRAAPARPVPVSPKLSTSSVPTPVLAARDDEDPNRVRGHWPLSADDDVPTSLSLSPPDRPPRGARA